MKLAMYGKRCSRSLCFLSSTTNPWPTPVGFEFYRSSNESLLETYIPVVHTPKIYWFLDRDLAAVAGVPDVMFVVAQAKF